MVLGVVRAAAAGGRAAISAAAVRWCRRRRCRRLWPPFIPRTLVVYSPLAGRTTTRTRTVFAYGLVVGFQETARLWTREESAWKKQLAEAQEQYLAERDRVSVQVVLKTLRLFSIFLLCKVRRLVLLRPERAFGPLLEQPPQVLWRSPRLPSCRPQGGSARATN